jgi:hypothetical protein
MMKTTIRAGTMGWFEVKFNGIDSANFNEDTEVELEVHSTWWYKTKGHVPGFPAGHPCILINNHWLPKDCA